MYKFCIYFMLMNGINIEVLEINLDKKMHEIEICCYLFYKTREI